MKRDGMYDLIVLGGGAAGLTAAITAARQWAANDKSYRIAIMERQDRVGKKLLATGNGRCNFTNINATIDHYHGRDQSFCEEALTRFHPLSTIHFFRELGVVGRVEEEGKVYPYSGQASSILDALRLEAEHLGIHIYTGCRVELVDKQDLYFRVQGSGSTLRSTYLIATTGGMAAPDLGGHKSGYKIMQSFGHSTVSILPALVQITTENQFPRALKGIKIRGKVKLCKHRSVLGEGSGEILFADYGLSGPPILQLSRILCDHPFDDLHLVLDFLQDFTLPQIQALLSERRQNLGHLTLEYYLAGLVHKKVGQMLIKHVLQCQLSRRVAALEASELDEIAKALKYYSLTVTGTLGWKHAQVTAGGIDTRDFRADTMESKLVSGLYCAGELLDIDGDCGGYNLQWAWASGRLAGESVARALEELDHDSH